MSEYPERFLPEIEAALDPAEIGTHGCLLPQLDDPTEGGGEDGPDE